jgi:hypothetical protein
VALRDRVPFLLLIAGLSAASHANEGHFEILILSNRADLVSGGDALVEVRVPKKVSGVKIKLNGADVTGAFVTTRAQTLRGLVTGLRDGANEVIAEGDGPGKSKRRARLRITNHPIGGPVLSGEQITPYFCATPTPQPATATTPATNASGLSTAAIDAQCNIASERKLYYRTTASGCSFTLPDANNPPANPCFRPYDPMLPPPADMARITPEHGIEIPYVVRVERGTMNRGIFDIAVLFDPSRPWSATAPQAQWNGKVLYQFGASTGQPRRQARTTSNWTSDLALSRGYLVAQSSMTDSALNSNRVSMAETVMMMKEHIGDSYGPIKFTIGSGCSGGSINSNMNASIAPGQLDGITIQCAYPDSETTGIEVNDCVLLAEAYQKPAWLALAAGQSQDAINLKKAAINGHLDQTGCHAWYNLFGSNGKAGNYVQRFVVNGTTGAIAPLGAPINNCQLPAALVYDPATNPTGERCAAWDWAASIWGKAADGVRARDTRDNTGVQYGLKALLAGAISTEEFVTLNEIIGGTDKNADFQAGRSVADPGAPEIAYRAGIVMSGRNLAKTAVIDLRGWDDAGGSAIHHQWRSFSIRARLDNEFGDHGNQAMWRFSTGLGAPGALAAEAFATMDDWLTRLKADTSALPIEEKVRRAKPENAFDFCLVGSERLTDPAACEARQARFKVSASPRQVAGGPLTEHIVQCTLKPLNHVDYAPLVFTPAQWARLQAVFAGGVCDWSQPGVGEQPAASPLTFAGGPGGEALPPPPKSLPH